MKLIPACAYLIALCMTTVGCTRESTRLAIQGSERSDQVRSFIIGQQHRTAKVLLDLYKLKMELMQTIMLYQQDISEVEMQLPI